jgi:hypothetical protein
MSERLDRAVLIARNCGWLPLLLRTVIAVGVVGAVVATAVPAWDVPDIYLLLAVVAGAVGVVVPDAGGALFCTAAVVVAWATGAPGGVGPAVVVTALCLLVVHVASALAAAMPVTARGDLRSAARWARPTAVLAIATIAAAGLAAAFDRWSPPGSLLLVLAALAVLAAGTWLLSTSGTRSER